MDAPGVALIVGLLSAAIPGFIGYRIALVVLPKRSWSWVLPVIFMALFSKPLANWMSDIYLQSVSTNAPAKDASPQHETQSIKMTDADLRAIVNDANKHLPWMQNDYLRMDSTSALSGLKLVRNYTLLNQVASSLSQPAIIALKKELLTYMIKKECSAGNELLNGGVTLIYHYSGSDGGFITEVEVTPSDCQH